MKNSIHSVLLMTAAGLLLLASCKKDETKIYFEGGTTPVLTSSAVDSVSLPFSDTTAVAVTFSWTNPNYMFSDGTSSETVQYYLQFDTTTAFSNPTTIGLSASLSVSYTVAQFNGLMANGLVLAAGVPHTVQARIQSQIPAFTSTSAPIGVMSSAPISFTVTPYATPPTVTPPPNDSLYIVGAAVAADNWANPMPPANIPAETFTKISPTEYKITVGLVGGGEYKLISANGSWTNQWSVAAADTYPNGGPFVFNGANCIAPASSGNYLIDVNFQTGKFTVTPQ